MNEESLNEIKQMDWENLKPSQIVAINYLIERVQELEDKLARIRFVNNDYDKQNKRYREALERQFGEFWEACVKVVGEDMAYDIVAEMPEEGEE